MKKILAMILCAAAVCAVAALASCSDQETHHPEGVEIVTDESRLTDVERNGNTVSVKCRVTVRNDTEKNAAVKLAASFPKEYKSGMYEIDFSVARVDGSEMVAVPAKGSVSVDAVFDVPLKQSYKGESLISSRDLPAISINEIEIDSDLLPPME